MKALSGFRDFFPQDFARRRYLMEQWRGAAQRYGFVEMEGPMLEPLALYQKKNSGGEILGQLYNFTDKGGREVALRPEMTPTLARMVAAKERQYIKPLRWFSMPTCFRYERQQRGRLREFLQFNADLIGAEGVLADAEVIALLIDLLRSFGLGPTDFTIRLSSRAVWQQFLQEQEVSEEALAGLLAIVDKKDRYPEEVLEEKLSAWREEAKNETVTPQLLTAFLTEQKASSLDPLLEELQARGLEAFITVDLGIVRGLAYYTGVVFEAFALQGTLRAIAGGGRYDRLIEDLSDGAAALPAIGFGLGDAVLLEILEEHAGAAAQLEQFLAAHPPVQLYLVVADEARRAEASALAQRCREKGLQVTFSLQQERLGKQFAAAEQLGARYALIVGSEWPQLKVKELASRQEEVVEVAEEAALEALLDGFVKELYSLGPIAPAA